MNVSIAPTVTCSTIEDYTAQMELVMQFAKRIHVDYADGIFAPRVMVSPQDSWIPDGYQIDMHVMNDKPSKVIDTLIALKPSLIILHAEANDKILELLHKIRLAGIKGGIALLQETDPELYATEIEDAHHVLIFGGQLGYQQKNAKADLGALAKIERVREINPNIEIGWDGGASNDNAPELIAAGVNSINVGGYIHNADKPQEAYAILEKTVKEHAS